MLKLFTVAIAIALACLPAEAQQTEQAVLEEMKNPISVSVCTDDIVQEAEDRILNAKDVKIFKKKELIVKELPFVIVNGEKRQMYKCLAEARGPKKGKVLPGDKWFVYQDIQGKILLSNQIIPETWDARENKHPYWNLAWASLLSAIGGVSWKSAIFF